MAGADEPVAPGRSRLIAAVAAAAIALAAAAGYETAMMGDEGALALNARVLPPPQFVQAGLLPPGDDHPPGQAWLSVLDRALGRSPLQQRLFNRVYVEATRRGDTAAAARDAALLTRLGWRDTATTQNLMLRDAVTSAAEPLLDRGESLLRRDQLENSVYRFLSALETVPSLRTRLLWRLRAHVTWRESYLAFDQLLQDDRVRRARLETIDLLLRSGDHVTRGEVAPLLQVMVTKGEDAAAWALWQRVGGAGAAASAGVLDPDFAIAHRLREVGAPLTPFDWQTASDNDSAASLPDFRPRGASLRWNGRGVPVFLSQRVKVPSAGPLRVELVATQAQAAARYLQPVLDCAGREIAFEPAGQRGRRVEYRANVPAGCSFATLSLRGRVTDDPSPDLGDIVAITLTGA